MPSQPAKPAPDETGAEHVVFAKTEGIPIRFADGFLVGGGTDIFTLNFYQSEIPRIKGKDFGKTTSNIQPPESTCIARIALSPIGFERLLKSMAGHIAKTRTEDKK